MPVPRGDARGYWECDRGDAASSIFAHDWPLDDGVRAMRLRDVMKAALGAGAILAAPEIEARIADWYDAPDPEAKKRAVAAINKASFDYVTYAPTGFFLQYQAWRKSLSGVVKAPFPVFWGVRKT